jgi:hypothetical protein
MLIHKTLATFIAASSTVKRTKTEWQFSADFAFTLIESLGKAVAARGLTQQHLKKWARTTASMLCDSLNVV